ncbi:hypothetical protein KP509_39G052700 [Ceratopteris richardii]|nr:hypothetical protein KP509_39G052700 [Ceratopteris richardii]
MATPNLHLQRKGFLLDHGDYQNLIPLQKNLGSSLTPLNSTSLQPIDFFDQGTPLKELKFEANLWSPGAAEQQQTRALTACDDVRGASFISMDVKAENGASFGPEISEGASTKKLKKRFDTDFDDVDSSAGLASSNEESGARTLKRPRLVWTPQLHKRFVEAVAQLGIKNAVPKTIMQLMNVDGLTRENVASHLQKYRLHLKRTHSHSLENPSTSDRLLTASPFPSLSGSPHFLSKHGDDLGPFLLPFPISMSNVSPPQMAEKLHHPLSNGDHNMYNGLIQPFACQRINHDYAFDGRMQAGSPRRQVLTLFPPNGI